MPDGANNTIPMKDKNNPAEEAEAEVTEETEKETTEETEATHSDTEIDYDAEIAAEKLRGKPDPKKAEEAFKERERRRKEKEEEDEEEEDDDKPLTRRELNALLGRHAEDLQKVTQSDRIKEIATNLASSPKEAEYIVEIHKNRSWPSSLSLNEQLEEAFVIANRKKILATNSELSRALKGKIGANRGGTGGTQEGLKAPTPKVAPDLAGSLKRSGFIWSNASKRYEKKMPNGKLLVKDTPTSPPKLV